MLFAIGFAINLSGERSAAATGPEAAAGGLPDQGRRVVTKYGCGSCHTISGIPGARGKVGPELTTMAERAYIAGNLPTTAENLVRWIMNPQGIEPGTAMPDLRVTEEDARSIVAYLYSLR